MVITSPESHDNNMGRKTLPPPPPLSRCTKETEGAATHYRARKYHNVQWPLGESQLLTERGQLDD